MPHLVDTHCHLDQYSDPTSVAMAAARAGVGIIAVTGLPSHYAAGVATVRSLHGVRLAVGMHPLLAPYAPAELDAFPRYAQMTPYVGEVGLDFSRHGLATRAAQLQGFTLVLDTLEALAKTGQRRFVTLHSRGAERPLIDALAARSLTGAVLHWYSGPVGVIADALAIGCYFSVNPAMLEAASGRRLLDRVPPEAILLESDGPYVQIGGRPARPDDLGAMVPRLAQAWGFDSRAAVGQLRDNLRTLLSTLGLSSRVSREGPP